MTKQQLLQVGGNCLILGHSGDTRASRATHRRQLPGPPWALRSACQATQPRGRRLARDQPRSLRWAPVGTRGSPRCGGARERGSRAGPHRHSCLHAGQRTRATAQSAHSVGLPGQGTPLAPSGAGGPRPARPACSMAQSQAQVQCHHCLHSSTWRTATLHRTSLFQQVEGPLLPCSRELINLHSAFLGPRGQPGARRKSLGGGTLWPSGEWLMKRHPRGCHTQSWPSQSTEALAAQGGLGLPAARCGGSPQ